MSRSSLCKNWLKLTKVWIGGSEVGRDQCGDPGIFVVCCCQFWVCSVRFAYVFFFVCGSGGLLSVRSTGFA